MDDVLELARLLRQIADPHRLALIAALGDGPVEVGALLRSASLCDTERARALARLVDVGIVERNTDRGSCGLVDLEIARACATLRSVVVCRLATAGRLDVFAIPESPQRLASSRRRPR